MAAAKKVRRNLISLVTRGKCCSARYSDISKTLLGTATSDCADALLRKWGPASLPVSKSSFVIRI
ncbi:hypothetical protein CY34DRAFT_800639 [Suillus luteus UH-Slu-Lm8-n1]|uniref:Uncharacterized protein n=1 Tax=Suillus luteus UH-Slu-Lm8-n1 TaxID=930992 RepID=A0A0D0A850_9AGAM|nr:hypothetical protein CY34DRAFT_800639 [Suillus luteus UH-Slu-Lm8-n1]